MLTKVTRNYQITIPSEIRKKLNIKEGEYLEVSLEEDAVVLKKSTLQWRTVKLGKRLSIEEIETSIERGMKSESGN